MQNVLYAHNYGLNYRWIVYFLCLWRFHVATCSLYHDVFLLHILSSAMVSLLWAIPKLWDTQYPETVCDGCSMSTGDAFSIWTRVFIRIGIPIVTRFMLKLGSSTFSHVYQSFELWTAQSNFSVTIFMFKPELSTLSHLYHTFELWTSRSNFSATIFMFKPGLSTFSHLYHTFELWTSRSNFSVTIFIIEPGLSTLSHLYHT